MTSAELFFHRSGIEVQGTVYADGTRRYTFEDRCCSRCGGQGGAEAWKHTGYTCYQCGGNGGRYKADVTVYTADQLAVLNARQEAKEAKKLAAVKAAQEAADAAFDAAYPEIVAKLALVANPSDFILDVVAKGRKFGVLTERQIEALNTALDREIDRAAQKIEKAATAQHIGTVGERRDFALTLAHVHAFEGTFGPVYIHILNDAEGNVIVYKGNKRLTGEKGEVVTFKATIKAHDARDGVAQTILARPAQK